jgi:hypothetical protein
MARTVARSRLMAVRPLEPKLAVIGDARRDQRMRGLQQDGPRPSEQHHPLRVNLTRNHSAIMA